jgi:hypothetical protein
VDWIVGDRIQFEYLLEAVSARLRTVGYTQARVTWTPHRQAFPKTEGQHKMPKPLAV